MGYGAVVGALVGPAQDSGGSSNNTGIVGNTLGISAGLDARDKNRAKRAAQEFQRLSREESAFNYDQAKAAQERSQDLAGSQLGHLQTDYLPSEMLGATDRSQMGGTALETLVGLSSGYNPAIASSPYMNINAADREQQAYLKELADYNTAKTLGGFEDSQRALLDSYEGAAGEMGAERDRMRGEYTASVEQGREEERDRTAQQIVETWIASNDKAGAAGNEDFIDRRSGKGNKVATMLTGIGRMPGKKGKAKGADEGAKAAYVQDMLDSGMSYSDLLSDPEFLEYVQADQNSGVLLRSWED